MTAALQQELPGFVGWCKRTGGAPILDVTSVPAGRWRTPAPAYLPGGGIRVDDHPLVTRQLHVLDIVEVGERAAWWLRIEEIGASRCRDAKRPWWWFA